MLSLLVTSVVGYKSLLKQTATNSWSCLVGLYLGWIVKGSVPPTNSCIELSCWWFLGYRVGTRRLLKSNNCDNGRQAYLCASCLRLRMIDSCIAKPSCPQKASFSVHTTIATWETNCIFSFRRESKKLTGTVRLVVYSISFCLFRPYEQNCR